MLYFIKISTNKIALKINYKLKLCNFFAKVSNKICRNMSDMHTCVRACVHMKYNMTWYAIRATARSNKWEPEPF